jgi:hypothetical protein
LTKANKDNTGRPRRFQEKEPIIRIALNLSEKENAAFKAAMKKKFPGATTTNVLLIMIENLCREARIVWPERTAN